MLRLMRSLVSATCPTIANTPPVRADAFGVGPPNAGWFADNATHTYCWGGGFNVALQNNAEYAMSVSLGNGTDITESFQGYNCTLATDVVWFDADLPEGVRGQYVCADFIGGDVCGQSTVTLDPVFLNQGDNDEEDTTKTACHEAGHSVGLTHSATATDCMRNGEVPNADVQWRRCNQHHKDHINGHY